jgi:hypothetical protein
MLHLGCSIRYSMVHVNISLAHSRQFEHHLEQHKLFIRGVFKKRPNFLNSAPTSTESALWLLSASSVRFWQQIAICPISLWALVIKLHPLNWARAQAVHRISDKVTMKELEEQQVCVKFYCKLGKHFTETFHLLNQAYGGDCMSRTQCCEWCIASRVGYFEEDNAYNAVKWAVKSL